MSSYPMKKNTSTTIVFPIFDNDGDLVTGAAGLDSEVSIDGGTFADCTNESTEIATSSGMYKLTLTAAETNGDVIAIIVKTTTTDAKTTPLVFYTSAQTLDEVDANVDTILSRVTGNVALASVCTETRLAELDAGNLPSDIDDILADTGELQTDWANGGRLDNILDARSSHAAADVWAVGTRALTDKVGFSLAADQSGVTIGTVNALAAAVIDAIWDELMSDHTTAGSFGQRLQIVRANTAQAGGTNTITLDAGASAVTDFYANQTIFLVGGTGIGQSKKISTYNGTSKVATVDSNWATQPDVTTVFLILPDYILTGTGASATEVWSYGTRALTDKAGFSLAADQSAVTIGTINALAAAALTSIEDEIWDAAISGHVGAGSFGAKNQKVVPSETIADYKATGFSTHSEADVWTTGSRELSTPNSYKADVSALALEASLTAIKGIGWIDENIKEIVDMLENGTYGLSAIEALVDDLESRLTAARAGYLDNLSAGAVALASVCTEARLAELDAANLPTDISTVNSIVTISRKIASNRWKIVSNQLIIYDDDEVTPLYTFDLKDSAGDPAMEDVYERVAA